MKRQEFIDNINTLADLVKVCTENRLEIFSDIVTEKAKDMIMNDICMNTIYDGGSWYDLKIYLSSLQVPCGYSYYFYNGYDGFEPLADSEFEWYKNLILQEMDNNEKWEPEFEEEIQEVTLEELIVYSQSKLQSIVSSVYYDNNEDEDEWEFEF